MITWPNTKAVKGRMQSSLSADPTQLLTLPTPKSLIRALVKHAGFEIKRLGDQKPFGQDVFSDINRLSLAWNYQIKCLFDVGANDGATAIAALSHFNEARIFAFEPHPLTFATLRENVSGPRFQAFNIAFGDKQGEAELFSYDNNKINSLVPDARYAMRFGKKGNPIKISISTIDDFCAAHCIATIDVLKIDTEGFDLSVMRGAAGKLARREVRFVYTEFNDIFEQPGRTGGALFPICDFLYPLGFRFVAAFTDYIVTEGEFFGVHNALFAAAPS
jgi:FkbM family methyltransferase